MRDKIPSLNSRPDTKVAVGFGPQRHKKQRPAKFVGRFNDHLPLARREFRTVVNELPSMKRGQPEPNTTPIIRPSVLSLGKTHYIPPFEFIWPVVWRRIANGELAMSDALAGGDHE